MTKPQCDTHGTNAIDSKPMKIDYLSRFIQVMLDKRDQSQAYYTFFEHIQFICYEKIIYSSMSLISHQTRITIHTGIDFDMLI